TAAGPTILGTTAPATVANAGTIMGTGGTAIRFGGGDDTLILDPGSVLVGGVDGAGGANTLELAVGDGSTGTIVGIGIAFSNFGNIAIDTGAEWTAKGAGKIAAGVTLTNDGTLLNRG